ncbi:hypothetical protein AB0B15_38345 [Streptomyces sp. NPDC045456]|uniref:hypothetical protein n=1 Tax=Streptomyces sp. NPDC045456 TaxID=3155254 RepID=UPI0033E64E93
MSEAPRAAANVVRLTAVKATTDQTGEPGEVECLASAAAAALCLLADAIQRGTSSPDAVVRALKAARVHTAFADVFDAASVAVINGLKDPLAFGERLRADSLSGTASRVRDALLRL